MPAPDNPNDWPIEVVVHSDEDFKAFARSLGHTEDQTNDLQFQSINSLSLPLSSPFNTHKDRVIRLHVPMWRWEVDKEELEKYPVTFL
jgi:hypothetical protein